MALFITRAPSCQSRDLAVGSALNDFVPSLTLGYVESIKFSSLYVVKTVLIIAYIFLSVSSVSFFVYQRDSLLVSFFLCIFLSVHFFIL